MTKNSTTKKRIQFTIDKGTAASAEFIINRAGLTPANIISMIYSEIANTGKIPVDLQATDDELAEAKLIRASYDLPTKKLDNDKAIDDFMNDDGGY